MSGYLSGGWPFVIAAYGWTALVLTVYGASLFVRLRRSR
jgi:hypothetical protein